MNGSSIGIEMSHIFGDYPVEQVNAVLDLLRKLRQAFPAVPAGRVIGHSDIGICEPSASKSLSASQPEAFGSQVE